jgi:hypothetical protein
MKRPALSKRVFALSIDRCGTGDLPAEASGEGWVLPMF